jgi:hypothetical protein
MGDTGDEQLLLLKERNAIERERLLAERLKDSEAELGALKAKMTINWSVVLPVVTAVIGATASVMLGSLTALWQADIAAASARAGSAAQALAAEHELIKLAIGAEASRADANMRFLSAAGLIPTFGKAVESALEKGETFSASAEAMRQCAAPGCFAAPVAQHPNGQQDRIFGDYVEQASGAQSHAYTNARQFCRDEGYTTVRDLEVACVGLDESGYLAVTDSGTWDYLDTGSGRSCYALIEWLRCEG